ncbi:MAG: DNA polymerase III subunit gamma/tau [Wujia sp.]
MSYMALYRKWRPDEFDEVKGQEHIVTTLRNQIKHERVGHAYLFCGTRGTGKTTTAKLMAKAVNCENPVDGSPCNTCASCKAIAAGAAMNVVEINAASNNGVDSIRQINESVTYSPATGKYLVYIVDEVHMLSGGAFNALLKTLEEPPSYVIFILATTESHKIPATITSRCQRYDFRRISLEVIADRLQELLEREGIAATREAIEYVARAADGSMRDGLSILEQCISYHLGEELTLDKVLAAIGAVDTDVYMQLFEAVKANDLVAALKVVDEAIWQGKDLLQFINEFTGFIRNLLVLSMDAGMSVDVTQELKNEMLQMVQGVSQDMLMHYIYVLQEAATKIPYATTKRIVLELAVIKLCKPEMREDTDSLNARLASLQQQLEQQQQLIEELRANPVTVVAAAGTQVQSVQAEPAPATGNASDRIKQNLKEKYPEAEYEELLLIAKAWKEFCKKQFRLVQNYYKSASLVPNKESGSLDIVVEDVDANSMVISYFSDPGVIQEIEEKITEMTKCKVHMGFRKVAGEEAVHQLRKDWDLNCIVFDDIHMYN